MSDEVPSETMYTCQHSRAELALMGESKWGIKHITYFIQSYPPGLSHAATDAVFVQAFTNWSSVCDLTFSRASDASSANIVINSGRGRRAKVDGPLGILAWCYLPSGDQFAGQLQMMLDADEDWTDGKAQSQSQIQMLNVVTHELGHGLGLDHTNIQRQLMNPVYSSAIAAPQPAYDIAQVVARYGQPSATPVPMPPVTPPPIPAPAPAPGGSPVLCKVQIGNQVYGGALSLLTSAKVELGE